MLNKTNDNRKFALPPKEPRAWTVFSQRHQNGNCGTSVWDDRRYASSWALPQGPPCSIPCKGSCAQRSSTRSISTGQKGETRKETHEKDRHLTLPSSVRFWTVKSLDNIFSGRSMFCRALLSRKNTYTHTRIGTHGLTACWLDGKGHGQWGGIGLKKFTSV